MIIKRIVVLIAFFILIISCENGINEPTDFRDKYIGKYQVIEKISCYGPCSTCSSQKDTVIVVNYGLTDLTLSVLGRDVKVDSSGWYSTYHYGLRLWNDSINSYFMNGGLGCGQYELYEGFRISDNP